MDNGTAAACVCMAGRLRPEHGGEAAVAFIKAWPERGCVEAAGGRQGLLLVGAV